MAEKPELDDPESYRFAERSVGESVQLEPRFTPPVSKQLCVLPPESFDEQKRLRREVAAWVSNEQMVTGLPYDSVGDTRWFRQGPMEYFMENILVEELWRVE